MKLTNTTRMTIDVVTKNSSGAPSTESIPPGETRSITAVDKEHPSYVAHIAAKNLVEGVLTNANAPAGAKAADTKPERT